MIYHGKLIVEFDFELFLKNLIIIYILEYSIFENEVLLLFLVLVVISFLII